MLINWFTVGAQIVNFLILVWLMKRFLFKPIREAIAARELRLSNERSQADTMRAEAKKDLDEFVHKNEAFEKGREDLLARARDQAAREGAILLESARSAAAALTLQHQDSIANEANTLRQTIRLSMLQEALAIVRKALSDLATTSLEERICDVFTRRLQALTPSARQTLVEAYHASTGPAVVRSAFELPPTGRGSVQHALNEMFSADVHVDFNVAPELVAGIELTLQGQKLGWSLAEYVTSLEHSLERMFKDPAKQGPSGDSPSPVNLQPKRQGPEHA